MKKVLLPILALALVACSTDIPNEVQLAASNQTADKNSAARSIIQEIRANYGSDAILTIGSSSPPGYDFSPQVKTFARRAAVSYTNNVPDFVVIYEVGRVDGFYTGPNIVNFEISASLLRPVSVNEGAEVIYFSSIRDRCRTDVRPGDSVCSVLQPQLAEALLYSLRKP